MADPTKAEEQMEGGETQPGFRDASEGTTVMSQFLEFSPKSWPWLPVSSPGSAPGYQDLAPTGAFHAQLATGCLSQQRADLAIWPDPGGCPALDSILGLTWAPDFSPALTWRAANGIQPHGPLYGPSSHRTSFNSLLSCPRSW